MGHFSVQGRQAICAHKRTPIRIKCAVGKGACRMAEEKSMAYTIILGVCMLLCLLMIGRMLLGHPTQDGQTQGTQPDTTEQGEGSGIEINEQALCDLLGQAMPIPAEQITAHIGADGTVSVALLVQRQALQDSGMVPGNLRTALMFLPAECKLYGAWQAEVKDGAVVLSCSEAKIGDLTLPPALADGLTEQLAAAVNGYLSAQGCTPQALRWADGVLTVEA